VKRLAALLLALALPAQGADAPLKADVGVSTKAADKGPIEFKLSFEPGDGVRVPKHIGVRAKLAEGKPLQMMLWGGAGAVVGTLAGPFGAAVGGAAGVVAGLLFSIFVQPPPAKR